MKKRFLPISGLSVFAVLTIWGSMLSSCGQQIPPTGGPRDSIAPKLVSANPGERTLNFKGNKIVLTFDEYIGVERPFEKLVISPTPKKFPDAIGKLREVTVKLKDTLEENTTYTIDFQDAIRDINENNPIKEFSYTFSTGSYIDSGFLVGRVINAENGKPDSTLIAVLQRDLSDSAVAKQTPRYYTRLKGDGSFTFKNIKPGTYNLFALKDVDGMKKYDQSSEMIGFLPKPVIIGKDTAFTLFAFKTEEEEKPKAKPALKADAKKNEDKRIKLSYSIESNRHDILTPIKITSDAPFKKLDTSKILLTNKEFKRIPNYRISTDTSNKQLLVDVPWTENTDYKLILQKEFVFDTLDNRQMKTDTITFTSKKESDYGSLDIRIENLDTTNHPILLLKKDDRISFQLKLVERRTKIKLFNPGEYQIAILYDINNNGKWDTGNYWKKLQPELIIPRKQTLNIRSNWDNEVKIDLKQVNGQ